MSTLTTPQKPFPIFVPDGHRGEKSIPSPSLDHHPYAIKTTSTGILTRSNSTGYGAPTRHTYVPTSPSPRSKHRFSRSDLTNDRSVEHPTLHISPRPLPIPPSLGSPTKAGRELHGGYVSSEDLRNISSWRNHRSEASSRALPTPPPSSPVKVDDLPSNPKIWTSTQLASYLITALRVRPAHSTSSPIPLAIAKDIAAFIRDARLSGRSFLRLNEQDLESMGVNGLWREALLNASRNLRHNVLKGRIWGTEADDQEDVFTSPFRYRAYNSSASSLDDIPGSLETTPSNKPRGHSSRVKGLVANLERTSSDGSGGSGSSFSNHGSATSEGDQYTNMAAWADDEGASASGSEASEAEGELRDSVTGKPLVQEPITPPVEVLQEIPAEIEVAGHQAEPTVKDLLSSNTSSPSYWGARAWEELDPGVTVKWLGAENDIEDAPLLKPTLTGTTFGRSSVRGIRRAGATNSNGKTAIKDIFSRPLPTPPSQSTSPRSGSPERASAKPAPSLIVKVDCSVQTDEDVETKSTSESSQQMDDQGPSEAERLNAALALVETLRARLRAVEENVRVLKAQKSEPETVEHAVQVIQTAPGESLAQELIVSSRTKTTKADEHQAPPTTALPSADESPDASGLDFEEVRAPGRFELDTLLKSGGDWDPLEGGVTSYVLMVGVGVCAVVLSTILKRMAVRRP